MHCKETFKKADTQKLTYTKYEALGLCTAEFIHSSEYWPLQIDCSGEGGRGYKHISKSAQPKMILKELIWNYFLVVSHQSVFLGASLTYPSCLLSFRNAKDHNRTLEGREET